MGEMAESVLKERMNDAKRTCIMNNRPYPPHSILTFTGKIVTPLDMNPDDIDIQDIAKSLSNQGRFLGHTQKFYSVAQHCCIGALALRHELEPPSVQLAFLLHDAAEAYLCDIPSPLKHSWVFNAYRSIEDRLQDMINAKYDVDGSAYRTPIKRMDLRMLITEKRDLRMTDDKWDADDMVSPLEDTIEPLDPQVAFLQFMVQAKRLDVSECRQMEGEDREGMQGI